MSHFHKTEGGIGFKKILTAFMRWQRERQAVAAQA